MKDWLALGQRLNSSFLGIFMFSAVTAPSEGATARSTPERFVALRAPATRSSRVLGLACVYMSRSSVL